MAEPIKYLKLVGELFTLYQKELLRVARKRMPCFI